MWDKVKASCLNSLTIAWGYCLAFVGTVLQGVDLTADALGDPNLKQQIADAVGGDPKRVGQIMLGISIVIIIARLRSLWKAS